MATLGLNISIICSSFNKANETFEKFPCTLSMTKLWLSLWLLFSSWEMYHYWCSFHCLILTQCRPTALPDFINIGSGNDLQTTRCKTITWTNYDLLLLVPWGTNLGKLKSRCHHLPFKNMHLKISSFSCHSLLETFMCLNFLTVSCFFSNCLQKRMLLKHTSGNNCSFDSSCDIDIEVGCYHELTLSSFSFQGSQQARIPVSK